MRKPTVDEKIILIKKKSTVDVMCTGITNHECVERLYFFFG